MIKRKVSSRINIRRRLNGEASVSVQASAYPTVPEIIK